MPLCTIPEALEELRKGRMIVLVDDASRDATLEVAHRLRLKTVAHDRNFGYGGNQKTCYHEALKLGADIVVMLPSRLSVFAQAAWRHGALPWCRCESGMMWSCSLATMVPRMEHRRQFASCGNVIRQSMCCR